MHSLFQASNLKLGAIPIKPEEMDSQLGIICMVLQKIRKG